MANGRSRTGSTTSPQNPRGPQFSIRSGDQNFVGRAANVEYVRHVVSAGRQSLLRACGEAVGEMIATEVDPDIRKLTRRLDALELENKNLRARIVAIDEK